MDSLFTHGNIVNQLTDEELAAFFRESGNHEIVGELFKRYAHLVLGVSIKYLHNRDEARDAAQDIFEKLFTSLKKYEVHNFKSWLLTVTKSHCAMILRNRKRDGVLVSWEDNLWDEVMENGSFQHHHEDDTEERIRKLHRALGDLSPGQQQCVLLFYFDGKSYHEIEEVTGFTPGEVKSHIQNGKRNLKIILEQQFYE